MSIDCIDPRIVNPMEYKLPSAFNGSRSLDVTVESEGEEELVEEVEEVEEEQGEEDEEEDEEEKSVVADAVDSLGSAPNITSDQRESHYNPSPSPVKLKSPIALRPGVAESVKGRRRTIVSRLLGHIELMAD